MSHNGANLFELFNKISKIVLWNAQGNDSNFEKVVLWQLSQVNRNYKPFSEETSYSQGTCVANPMLLQPTIQALKILYYVPHCTNECAKEKEEKEQKTIIITKYHGKLLATMSNCLLNNMLVY